MRVIVTDDYESMSQEAARLVASQLYIKPDSVLGLATGSTPLGLYRQLRELHQKIRLDFSEVITFNLDEYLTLSPDNPQSYHYYMEHNLFSGINIDRRHCHLPNGLAEDTAGECAVYDQMLEAAGGVDLQILGIGVNAHIGFNEPDIKFEARTHVVRLNEETRRENARFFPRVEDVPDHAISMGIRNIMMAKKILLLASGPKKAAAIYKTVCGSILPQAPASILQLHRDAVIIVDRAAASLLPEDKVWKYAKS